MPLIARANPLQTALRLLDEAYAARDKFREDNRELLEHLAMLEESVEVSEVHVKTLIRPQYTGKQGSFTAHDGKYVVVSVTAKKKTVLDYEALFNLLPKHEQKDATTVDEAKINEYVLSGHFDEAVVRANTTVEDMTPAVSFKPKKGEG